MRNGLRGSRITGRRRRSTEAAATGAVARLTEPGFADEGLNSGELAHTVASGEGGAMSH